MESPNVNRPGSCGTFSRPEGPGSYDNYSRPDQPGSCDISSRSDQPGSCGTSSRPDRPGSCDKSTRPESHNEDRMGSCDQHSRPESPNGARTGSRNKNLRSESPGETITGSCDQPPRPESLDEVHTGSCGKTPRPESYDCQSLVYHGCFPESIATFTNKSAYIAIRLMQLHEQRAIQQREWESERRFLEQEKKAIRLKNKLLDELAERKRATKYRKGIAAVKPSAVVHTAHTSDIDTTKHKIDETVIIGCVVNKSSKQQKLIVEPEIRLNLVMRLARMETPAHQILLHGTQQQRNCACPQTIEKEQNDYSMIKMFCSPVSHHTYHTSSSAEIDTQRILTNQYTKIEHVYAPPNVVAPIAPDPAPPPVQKLTQLYGSPSIAVFHGVRSKRTIEVGNEAIIDFVEGHQCEAICKQIQLTNGWWLRAFSTGIKLETLPKSTLYTTDDGLPKRTKSAADVRASKPTVLSSGKQRTSVTRTLSRIRYYRERSVIHSGMNDTFLGSIEHFQRTASNKCGLQVNLHHSDSTDRSVRVTPVTLIAQVFESSANYSYCKILLHEQPSLWRSWMNRFQCYECSDSNRNRLRYRRCRCRWLEHDCGWLISLRGTEKEFISKIIEHFRFWATGIQVRGDRVMPCMKKVNLFAGGTTLLHRYTSELVQQGALGWYNNIANNMIFWNRYDRRIYEWKGSWNKLECSSPPENSNSGYNVNSGGERKWKIIRTLVKGPLTLLCTKDKCQTPHIDALWNISAVQMRVDVIIRRGRIIEISIVFDLDISASQRNFVMTDSKSSPLLVPTGVRFIVLRLLLLSLAILSVHFNGTLINTINRYHHECKNEIESVVATFSCRPQVLT
nr:uncharacterized protein LOC115260704 [Aedes albopictus]